MPGNYIVHNEELIDGNFPVRILDPDQYGVYSTDTFTTPFNASGYMPIISKVSGGLADPVNNAIALKQGIYIIRLPEYYIDSSSLRDQLFRIYDENTQIIASYAINQYKDIAPGLVQNVTPVFIFVLDKDSTIQVRTFVYDGYTFTLSTDSEYINKLMIIKLDQPRISSLDKGVDGATTIIDGNGKIRAIEVAKSIGGSITENVVKFVANSKATIADIIAKINGLITKLDNMGLLLAKGGYQLRMKRPIVRTLVAERAQNNNFSIVWNADEDCYVTVEIWGNTIAAHSDIIIYFDGFLVFRRWMILDPIIQPMFEQTEVIRKGQGITVYSSGGESRDIRIYKIASEYAPANAGY